MALLSAGEPFPCPQREHTPDPPPDATGPPCPVGAADALAEGSAVTMSSTLGGGGGGGAFSIFGCSEAVCVGAAAGFGSSFRVM